MPDPLQPGSPELLRLQERLGQDTHVLAIEALIAKLDCRALYEAYRGTGSKPYRPERLLAIAILMILQGIPSPAKWARHIKNDDRCRLVGRGITPGRSTCYRFRDRAAKFIEAVHTAMIQDAIDDRSIDPVEGCLDGTFVAAAASRHKMLTLKQISRRLSVIKRAIATLDDPSQVTSRRPLRTVPRWLANTSLGRREQLARYREAKSRILNEIRANRELPNSLRRCEQSIKVSPADADAVIGKDKLKNTRPLYNIQTMCDFHSDVILAFGVFRKKNDNGTLIPMIEKTQQITGRKLQRAHADSGYCSVLEVKDCVEMDVDLYAPVPERKGSKGRLCDSGELQIPVDEFSWDESTGSLICPAGHGMRRVCRSKDPRADGRYVIELRFEQEESRCGVCKQAGKCLAAGSKRRTARRLEDQSLLDAQKVKMDSATGRSSTRMRKSRIERRYGDSKRHRGGSELHGRRLWRAAAETGLKVMAQNCLTLYLLEKRRKKTPG